MKERKPEEIPDFTKTLNIAGIQVEVVLFERGLKNQHWAFIVHGKEGLSFLTMDEAALISSAFSELQQRKAGAPL